VDVAPRRRGTRPGGIPGHGVEPGEVRRRYGAEGYGSSLYIIDPDGNVVELKGPPEQPAR